MRTSPQKSHMLILALAILLTLLLPLAAFGQTVGAGDQATSTTTNMSGELPPKEKGPAKEIMKKAEVKKVIKKEVKKEVVKKEIKKAIIKKAVKKEVKKELKK